MISQNKARGVVLRRQFPERSSDSTGIVWEREFESPNGNGAGGAFGCLDGNANGAWPNSRGFVGGFVDDQAGLTRLGARSYDSGLGSFISPGPVVDTADSQQMHGYAYANNNPVTYTDPDGLKVRKFLSGLKSRFSSMKNKVSNGARRTWNSKPFRNIRSNIRQRATNFSNKTYNTVRSIYRRFPHRDKIFNFASGAQRTVRIFVPSVLVTDWVFTKVGLPSMEEAAAGAGADPESGAYKLGEAVPELLVPGGWAVRGARGAANLVGSLRDDRKDDALSCALGNSFVRGTRVLMADGSHKPIEDVRIGDQVWASDPETGEEEPRTVLATIVGEGVKTLVEITVETATQIDAGTLGQGDLPDGPSRPGPTVLGDAVIATDGHPFWVPLLGEWVDAIDLIPGMWFLSSEGTLVQVAGTRVWTEPEQVYNLTVQDLHTYYVMAGETPVLVHNSGGYPTGAPRSADGKFSKRNGEPGRDGAADEANAWDQLEMDGAVVMRNETAVSAPGMRVRKYDGTVEINGRWYGIEVKGGTAKKNPQQRQFDDWLNTPGNTVTTGDGRRLFGVHDVWIDR